MSDIETLTNLFAKTYDPNPNVRKAAELEIRKVNHLHYLLLYLCSNRPGLRIQ